MTSFHHLALLSYAVVAAAGLSACSGVAPRTDPVAVAAPDPGHQRANNCRSGYSMSTQKGCVQDLPYWTASLKK